MKTGANTGTAAGFLALGTVQLGMSYGIANAHGQPDMAEARDLVGAAWKRGVRFFDTAEAYGSSESILGEVLHALRAQTKARVISKLPPEFDMDSAVAILELARASLERLRIPALWAMLLHRQSQMDRWSDSLGDALRDVRQRGWTRHLGVSVSDVKGAKQALALPDLEVIQVPMNVFDRRFMRAGVVDEASHSGRSIFIRSVYLQGLVLMHPGQVERRLPAAARAVTTFCDFCESHNVDRAKFSVDYVRHCAPEGILVIGAETTPQVKRNCALLEEPSCDPALFDEWDAIWPQDDDTFIHPPAWPQEVQQ